MIPRVVIDCTSVTPGGESDFERTLEHSVLSVSRLTAKGSFSTICQYQIRVGPMVVNEMTMARLYPL